MAFSPSPGCSSPAALTVEQKKSAAKALLEKGLWQEAEEALRSLWQEKPEAGVANNLAAALYSQGKEEEAKHFLYQAISCQPSAIDPYVNLASLLCASGKEEEALALLEGALPHIELTTLSCEKLLQPLTALWQKKGCGAKAQEFLQRTLAQGAGSAPVFYLASGCRLLLNQVEEGIELLLQALCCDENFSAAYAALTQALRTERGWAYVDRALNKVGEQAAKKYRLLGAALALQGSYKAAISCLRRTQEEAFPSCSALFQLGFCYLQQNQLELAKQALLSGLALDPSNAQGHANLGSCYFRQGSDASALACFERAIALNDKDSLPHYNVAILCSDAGHYDRAEASFKKTLECNPGHTLAHIGLGHLLLLKGKWQEGWGHYEYRKRLSDPNAPLFTLGSWSHQDFSQKSVLVCSEQGIGDSIQFLRYLKKLKDRGARVLFAGPSSLLPLLETAPFIDALCDKEKPLPQADETCSLLSLPLLFGSDPSQEETGDSYLQTPYSTIWQKRFDTPKFKVGLVWAGSPHYRNDANRSLSFSALRPLIKRGSEKVRFYSLQVGQAASQLLPSDLVEDISPFLSDYRQTASALTALDLVITVDTSVAHLAGALGKTVWTLLPFIPDWRWQLQTSKTFWYKSMRLFRQPAPKAWEAVLQQVEEALPSLFEQSPS